MIRTPLYDAFANICAQVSSIALMRIGSKVKITTATTEEMLSRIVEPELREIVKRGLPEYVWSEAPELGCGSLTHYKPEGLRLDLALLNAKDRTTLLYINKNEGFAVLFEFDLSYT